MADFIVDVGFSTQELQGMIGQPQQGGGGGNGGSNFGVIGNIGKGVKLGLASLGIVGLLTNLRSVLDFLGFLLGAISTALAFLVNSYIQYLIPFFQDPGRAFIGLIVDLSNAILTGIEFLANIIIRGLNAVSGTFGGPQLDLVELPRFQKDIILEAFDDLSAVGKEFLKGEASLQELNNAQKDYITVWSDALLTKEEFENVKELSKQTGLDLQDSTKAVSILGEEVNTFLEQGFETIVQTTDTTTDSIKRTLEYIDKKMKEVRDENVVEVKGATNVKPTQSPVDFLRNKYNKNLGFREG